MKILFIFIQLLTTTLVYAQGETCIVGCAHHTEKNISYGIVERGTQSWVGPGNYLQTGDHQHQGQFTIDRKEHEHTKTDLIADISDRNFYYLGERFDRVHLELVTSETLGKIETFINARKLLKEGGVLTLDGLDLYSIGWDEDPRVVFTQEEARDLYFLGVGRELKIDPITIPRKSPFSPKYKSRLSLRDGVLEAPLYETYLRKFFASIGFGNLKFHFNKKLDVNGRENQSWIEVTKVPLNEEPQAEQVRSFFEKISSFSDGSSLYSPGTNAFIEKTSNGNYHDFHAYSLVQPELTATEMLRNLEKLLKNDLNTQEKIRDFLEGHSDFFEYFILDQGRRTKKHLSRYETLLQTLKLGMPVCGRVLPSAPVPPQKISQIQVLNRVLPVQQVDARDDNTRLHWAVSKAEVQDLLKKDSRLLEARNELGSTPLYSAAERGYSDVVLALIQAGADIKAPQLSSGYTPLHVAVQRGHIDAVKTLIENGAPRNTKNDLGLSPLELLKNFRSSIPHADQIQAILETKSN